MKRRGFTLVELLAVMVILSIIGLVLVPIVLNYIEKSRIESYEISVKTAIDAAKEYVTKYQENNDFPEGGIDISKVDLKLDNNKFISGIIKRNEEGVIVAENIYNGKYCASGTKNNIVVEKVESEEECKVIDVTPPELKIKVNNVTATSITVVALAKDSLSEIKSYKYCIGDECSEEINKNNYTFEDLKPGEIYTITVTVKSENSGIGNYADKPDLTDTTLTVEATTEIIENAKFKVSTSSYAGEKEVTILYPDGNYEYRYEILDINGNIKETKNVEDTEVILNIEKNCIIKAYVKYENQEFENELYVVGIDKSGPKVVVIMNDNWEQAKQIKVIATDGVGIATKGYSYDGGKKWSSNNFRTYMGNQTIKLIVRDKLGNITDSYKICKDETQTDCYEASEIVISKIDREPPTCILKITSGTKGNNEWYTSNVTIAFASVNDKAKDENDNLIAGSGVASQKIDQSSLTKDGKYKITAIVTDNVGNEGKCYIEEVKVDKTNPSVPTSEIRYNSSSGSIRGSINDWTSNTLWWGNFRSTDNLSGIDYYEYSSGCNDRKTDNLNTKGYTYSSTVNYTFCIRSVDKSGRVSAWSSQNYIKVDKTSPNVPTSEIRYNSSSGSIRGNLNVWTNQTLWWGNYRGTDDHSGIDHYEYSNGCTGKASGTLATNGYIYSGNNINYKFCIRSVDKVGNVSSWSSPYYIKIDKISPTITLNPIGTRYGDGYKDGLVVNVVCSDNSGVILQNTGSSSLSGPGWRTVNGMCKDEAGNLSTTSGSYLIYVYTADQNACGTEQYVCGQYECGTENYNCSSCKTGSPSVCQGGYVYGTTYGQCQECGADYSRCKGYYYPTYSGSGECSRSCSGTCSHIGTNNWQCSSGVCTGYYWAYCNSCPTRVWSNCATTVNTCQYGCDTRPKYCDSYCSRAKSCWHL